MTGGVFNILHPGHARYLQKAKKLGDLLIVAVNSDLSTRKIKGPKRPINSQETRTEMLAALESVDYVTIFVETTPINIIKAIKPDIWVKRGQYKENEMPETNIVKKYKGLVRILPLEGRFSASSLVENILEKKPIKQHQKGSFVR